jgi:hypothetical protein
LFHGLTYCCIRRWLPIDRPNPIAGGWRLVYRFGAPSDVPPFTNRVAESATANED